MIMFLCRYLFWLFYKLTFEVDNYDLNFDNIKLIAF